MFICVIWLFDWYFPQFCKSEMLKYGLSRSFSEGPFDFEITRVDCICLFLFCCHKVNKTSIITSQNNLTMKAIDRCFDTLTYNISCI